MDFDDDGDDYYMNLIMADDKDCMTTLTFRVHTQHPLILHSE